MVRMGNTSGGGTLAADFKTFTSSTTRTSSSLFVTLYSSVSRLLTSAGLVHSKMTQKNWDQTVQDIMSIFVLSRTRKL